MMLGVWQQKELLAYNDAYQALHQAPKVCRFCIIRFCTQQDLARSPGNFRDCECTGEQALAHKQQGRLQGLCFLLALAPTQPEKSMPLAPSQTASGTSRYSIASVA